jgi:hypothetical protein
MPDAPLVYQVGLEELARLDPERATLRVLLVQPSYQPDRAHRVLDDETSAGPRAHELAVDDYQRQVLAGVELVQVADEDALDLRAAAVAFGALGTGERIGGAIIFREAGSDRLSPPILFHPLGRQGTTGGPVTLEWPDGRVLRWRPLPAVV